MKQILNRILSKFGFIVYSGKKVRFYSTEELKKAYSLDAYDVSYLRGKANGGLKENLLGENKKRWLEIGCGGNLEENFTYVDTFPESIVAQKGRYYRIDIVNASEDELKRIGKYDLIRMQHVFEHFTPENGLKVLNNCAELLNPEGYILITTPDLKRFAHLYLSGKIKDDFDWATKRVNKNSPDSFYFSMFAHSVLYEKHEWCYDAEGLKYQLEMTKKFKNIREITLEDQLANIPFTHNRPHQDVCVIAQLM